jgi:NAD(P)-dependent dehydrogenase (short-subunit alcohol dehydrogenase family)
MKLKDKVAVITGSASGMGTAITKLYAKEGAKVVATDIDFEGLQKVVDEIKADGGEVVALKADVSKKEDVEKMVDKAVSTYGTLDILVNNAGVMDNFRTAEDVSDEIWKRVFAINVDGPMMAIRKALPIFLEKGNGVIINISSIGGLRGSRAGIAYTASKHAVNGITKNVGFQYAQKGIRCNAIAPGGVKTSIGNTIKNPSQFGSERAQAGANLNPRYGEPEEIAKVALFLASDDSSFVNGEIIVADGGWIAY